MFEPAQAELNASPELDELAAMARVRGRLLGIAQPPPRIGRYRILGRLGQGGMGLVYAARDDELDRAVAIKMLRRDLAGADARQRFLREAQALARLSHPNVVQVYEVGHHDREVYIAMELVEGTTLRKWCAEQPRTWREIVRVFVGAGRGLAAAHRVGLVHRDFKPDNVIVDADERPRVLDFGVAHLHAEPIGIVPVSLAPCTSGSMTLPGAVMGTVAYMAPEQRNGERADARADQFAFGVALFEALYGQRPPVEVTTEEIGRTPAQLEARTRRRLRTASRSHPTLRMDRRVPAWLHEVLVRAMAMDADDRWPSMDALLVQLQSPPRRTRLALVGLGVAAMLAAGAGLVDHARATAACDDDAQALASWWTDARAEAGAGLLATGSPTAEPTWAHATRRLDAYVQEWTALHTSTCRSTRVDGDRSESMLAASRACLDERRAWLESLVGIWSHAEPMDVQGVAPATAGLPALEPCASPTGIEPALEVVRIARAELFRAEAAMRAGRFDDALARVSAIDTSSDDALHADAQLFAARLHMELTHYAAAEEASEAAVIAATRAGRADLVADAAATLATAVGIQHRFADAKHWSAMAEAALASAEVSPETPQWARVRGQLAAVAGQRGDFATSLALYRESLHVFEATFGPEHLETINTLESVAVELTQLGADEEAAATYERLLEVRERVFGPEHPSVSYTLTNYGVLLCRQGRFAASIRMHERAIAIDSAVYGPEHPYIATNLANIADNWSEMGDDAQALAALQRVLEIERKVADDTIYVARAHGGMALALFHLGRPDEAMPLAESALRIDTRELGPDHPSTAWSHLTLGYLLHRTKRYAESREHLERSIAILEAASLPESASVADARAELGQSILAAGDPTAALRHFELAAAVLERPGSSALYRARNRFGRAQAIAALGDKSGGVALAQQAGETFAELGARADRAEVTAWLGQQGVPQ